MIDDPIFAFNLSFRYTGRIYFRYPEIKENMEYHFVVDDSFKDTFANLLHEIYSAVFGEDLITKVQWLDEKNEYICEEIPEMEYGTCYDYCTSKFKVFCSNFCENKKFDSFEIGLTRRAFYILLYNGNKKGGYAYYGIDPDTPLSYFGIDENELAVAAKKLIKFAYPGRELSLANRFHRRDASVRNSGAVYNRLSFDVDL